VNVKKIYISAIMLTKRQYRGALFVFGWNDFRFDISDYQFKFNYLLVEYLSFSRGT